jgi:ribose/xylose/arabinose/galactoside ABC-type transport system permease subunit
MLAALNSFLLEVKSTPGPYIVWLEGIGQLKNAVTSSGIEPATFWLVTYCLNQLLYRMSPDITVSSLNKGDTRLGFRCHLRSIL